MIFQKNHFEDKIILKTIKGEQNIETVFDFANGVQISDSKLEYKGKVYNGK